MSDSFVARAPGKLFLLGEYAVLDGAPAVVTAIDRHVEVRLTMNPTTSITGIVARELGASATFPTTAPPAAQGPLRFVVAAFESSLRRFPHLASAGFVIDIVSRLDVGAETKIGLGSSAAVAVAVSAAMLAAARHDAAFDRDELFATAWQVHRGAQHGIGSGADVAASVYGGMILFEPRSMSLPRIAPLTLPAGAELLAGWSGESAATETLVAQYRAASNGLAAKRRAFVESSRVCVDAFSGSLRRGTLALDAVNENGAALERLAHDVNLPLLTPRLIQLIAIARAHGAAAKISGAGGGDCAVALANDAATGRRIRAAWQAAELTALDLGISRKGVTVARA